MNNKNTTHAYMYRLGNIVSTYTHETTMTVSKKFNFPIKYSVVPNVILTIGRHGHTIKTS